MNIIKKITISLSESDVREIVAEYLARQGYKVSKTDVQLIVGNEWHGYGMDEHQVAVFKECSVIIKGEIK
jgi:hypothetical protein